MVSWFRNHPRAGRCMKLKDILKAPSSSIRQPMSLFPYHQPSNRTLPKVFLPWSTVPWTIPGDPSIKCKGELIRSSTEYTWLEKSPLSDDPEISLLLWVTAWQGGIGDGDPTIINSKSGKPIYPPEPDIFLLHHETTGKLKSTKKHWRGKGPSMKKSLLELNCHGNHSPKR